MNEQTAKLLEQLANKLGTTSEYLWGILLTQAPIDAITTIFQILVLIFIGKLLWGVHKKLLSKTEDGCDSYYEKHDNAIFVMYLASGIWAILMVVAFFHIPSIIYGLLNPEYWALKEILKSLNGCN